MPIGLNEISTGMFFNNELTIENVPKNVTKIGEMAFFGCKMSRFEIHKDITEIGEGAFANCSNLTYMSYLSTARLLASQPHRAHSCKR